MKQCSKCREWGPPSVFSIARSSKDGLFCYCKPCAQARVRLDNPKINAVSKLAYSLAGGSKRFYSLNQSARREIRRAAADLYSVRQEATWTYKQIDEDFEANHKRGFIYAITNPAFPGWVKVGMTTDPLRRLEGYQTGDPFRDFKLEAAKQVEDRRQAELELHQELEAFGRRQNEWFEVPVEFVVSRLQ